MMFREKKLGLIPPGVRSKIKDKDKNLCINLKPVASSSRVQTDFPCFCSKASHAELFSWAEQI